MIATTLDQLPDTPEMKSQDWRIISLIGIGHSSSHFFQLVLPTLFLSLEHEFGFSFGQLGFLASIFFLVSSIGQASSGFVVDRIGPTPVLCFGLSCFVVSALLMGMANGYLLLAVAAFVGGLGNSVFHPVDYSLINHRVSSRRLGHAYSTHGFTGNLGWALTPIFMTTIIHFANWRVAVFSVAGLVALVLLMIWLGRDLLSGASQRASVKPAAVPAPEKAAAVVGKSGLANQSVRTTLAVLLVQPALWGAFFFFVFSSIGLSAVQNYTIPMLNDVYGIDKVLAGTALSGYMLASAMGMIAGGFLVNATPNTERTVAVSLVLAGLLLVVLALGLVGPLVAMVFVGLAGFCAGLASPSRDMLIRRVTPKGATGTVYGLVYSGMDVGASIGPVAFGLMLDVGFNQGPWIGAGVAFSIAAFAAIGVAKSVVNRDRAAAMTTA